MTKQELIAKLESEREALEDAIGPLSTEDMLAPRVVGEWSIKDVLAHLAMYTARCVTVIYHAEQNEKPQEIEPMLDDWEALNANDYESQKDRPIDRILSDFRGAHRQLLKRLEAWKDESALFDPKRFPWLRGTSLAAFIQSETADHDAEHRAQLPVVSSKW
jgi:hypothetical protein